MGEIRAIEQDLQKIEQAIADTAKELYGAYQRYLQVLGKGIGQQLVFASYHICTQGFPEAFLKLSFSQRQKIQQEIRDKSKLAVQELQELLNQYPESQDKSDDTSAAKLMVSILNEEENKKQEVVPETKDQQKDIEFDSYELFMTEISSKTTTDSQDKEVGNKDQENINETEAKKKKTSTENIIEKLHSIDILIHWQENIEKQIPEILRKLSDQTNCILHEGEILAKKIPQKVLEAATKMESENTPVGGRPNLLSLLVEAEDAEEDDDAKVTRIIAINLRLSEIEFADINIAAWRDKIRSLNGKLSQLQLEYRKKQRELAVMEAESAWRSSWYED